MGDHNVSSSGSGGNGRRVPWQVTLFAGGALLVIGGQAVAGRIVLLGGVLYLFWPELRRYCPTRRRADGD